MFRSIALGLVLLMSTWVAVQAQPVPIRIAVSTSWLESAIGDIAGEQASILRLCPPGTCPGHYDISPGAVKELRECRLLFRFHFQQGMDSRLRSFGAEIISITAPEGLCIPEKYLVACEEVCKVLIRTYPDHRTLFEKRQSSVRARLNKLKDELHEKISGAGLKGIRVLSSGHQAAFCEWLGLSVHSTFSGGESLTPGQIQSILKTSAQAQVRYVIGNKQEGLQAAETLAHHLKVPLVVFSNFPDMTEQQMDFDSLVRKNVRNLIEASHGSS